MNYFYTASIAELTDETVTPEVARYFSTLQLEFEKVVTQISKDNFAHAIALLNQLDVKMRLVLFYVNNQDFHESEMEHTIIEIIEREHFKFFREEVQFPDINLITRHSICCRLIDKSESSIEHTGFLWDIQIGKTINNDLGKYYLSKREHKLIQNYTRVLRRKANILLNDLSVDNFSSHYPELFLIDVKFQLLIESLTQFIDLFSSVREVIKDIEDSGLKDFSDRFSYRMNLDNRTIRFPFVG